MIPARRILPKMIRYRLFRLGIGGPGMPFNLTYSVTNRCQSRCKTCRIWELYRKDPAKAQEELDLQEIERIFRSMGGSLFCGRILRRSSPWPAPTWRRP